MKWSKLSEAKIVINKPFTISQGLIDLDDIGACNMPDAKGTTSEPDVIITVSLMKEIDKALKASMSKEMHEQVVADLVSVQSPFHNGRCMLCGTDQLGMADVPSDLAVACQNCGACAKVNLVVGLK